MNVVKVFMDDQSAIVSGIGNYLIAEILYDAKISPFRDLRKLSYTDLLHLANSILKVTKSAYYDNTTGYMIMFPSFAKTHKQKVDDGIFPNYHPNIKITKSFEFKVYRNDVDPFGNEVQQDKILKNRTIHWVPNVQR